MKELMYRLDGHKVDLMPYAVFAAHLFTAKNEWVDRIYTDKIVADYVSRESCNEYKKSAENKAQMTLDKIDRHNSKNGKRKSDATLQYIKKAHKHLISNLDETRTFTYPHFIFVHNVSCFDEIDDFDEYENDAALRRYLCYSILSHIAQGNTVDKLLENIYGRENFLDAAPYNTDLTFPAYMYMIWNSVISYFETLKGIERAYLSQYVGSVSKYKVSEEKIEKCFKKGKSPLRDYFMGKINVAEFNCARVQKYMNRPSDFEVDYLYLFLSKGSSSIKKEVSNASLNIRHMASEFATFNTFRSDMELMYDLAEASSVGIFDLFEIQSYIEDAIADKQRAECRLRDAERDKQATERQLIKCKNKLEATNNEIIKVRDENKALKVYKSNTEELDKLREKVEELKNELKQVKIEKDNIEKESTEQKRKNAKLLRDVRVIDAYKSVYGELNVAEDDDEDDIEVEAISEDQMIEELKGLKIGIVSCEKSIMDKFEKLGFEDVYLIDAENSVNLNKSYDIVVTMADYAAHKIAYAANKMVESTGAISMYYSGCNIHKIIEALYKYLNK